MLLERKVAVITGMGPGLGQELAAAFVREGADIGICCRRRAELERITAECRRQGGRVVPVVADVTDPRQAASVVDATVERFGRLDIVVNSAYDPGPFGAFAEADLDEWRRPLEVNLLGALTMIQLALPHLRSAGGGAIVNVTSMIQRKPLPFSGAYGTSKAALAGATRMLAAELGAEGIRVNSACMGWMWGPSVESTVQTMAEARGVSTEEVVDEIAANIPLGRIPDDAECADAVVFLASDLASAITGVSLDVNGGEYMA